MKSFARVMLAFFLMMMPSLVKAQGDLAAFDLKGKVKLCTWVNHKAGCIYKGFSKEENKEILVFAQNGRCLKWNGAPFAKEGVMGNALYNGCERDKKGRIVYGPLYTAFWNPGSADDTFVYNAQGKLAKHIYEDAAMLIETTFAYDARGNVVSTTSKLEDANTEKTSTIKVTYTIQAKDAKGNWTKRLAKRTNGSSWIETRTITYYSAK